MRRTPASLYGFLLWMATAVVCLGLSIAWHSVSFLVSALIAFILALFELHEAMP